MGREPKKHYVIRHRVDKYGNTLWWRPRSCGYTSELLAAGIYTEEQAQRIERGRETDEAVPLADALRGLDRGTVGAFFGARHYMAVRVEAERDAEEDR